jgi:hypothetical protein
MHPALLLCVRVLVPRTTTEEKPDKRRYAAYIYTWPRLECESKGMAVRD